MLKPYAYTERVCRDNSVRKVYDDLEGRSVILGKGKIVMTFQKYCLTGFLPDAYQHIG